MDWDKDGNLNSAGSEDIDYEDSELHRNAGVFWHQLPVARTAGVPADRTATRNSHSLTSVYDGTSQTIMFSENINAGGDATWASPGWSNAGFVAILTAPVATGVNTYYRPLLYDDPTTTALLVKLTSTATRTPTFQRLLTHVLPALTPDILVLPTSLL